MKPIFKLMAIMAVLFSFHTTIMAQDESKDNTEVYDVVDVMPQFPGGTEGLMTYLSENMKYTKKAQKYGIQGRVLVQFVIDQEGKVVETKILRSVDSDLDKEALRVVRAMPLWTPGIIKGEPVRVRYTLPITFRLK